MHTSNNIVYKDHCFSLNSQLIEQQKINDEELNKIKELHIQRLKIEDAFSLGQLSADDYIEAWEMNQFYLQSAWKFPLNKNFHMFWTMKECSCGSHQNTRNYPNGPYIYSPTCEVHKKLKAP